MKLKLQKALYNNYYITIWGGTDNNIFIDMTDDTWHICQEDLMLSVQNLLTEFNITQEDTFLSYVEDAAANAAIINLFVLIDTIVEDSNK